ncbi:hypothetical protein KR026_006755 [Drosophila bipectinata]|nr:hypothetical protein KR026_006755 [Drosophila bipectinata]
MDYQYYDEESDYIDVDDGDEDVEDDPSDFTYDDSLREEDYYGGGYEEDGIQLPDGYLEILRSCAQPSLLQVIQYVAPMLVVCLGCRLLCSLHAGRRKIQPGEAASAGSSSIPLHLIHLASGLMILYVTLSHRLALILLLSVVGYVLLQLARLGRRGAVILAFVTIGSQFIYELLIWRQRSDWSQLRGIQMVVNMKVISLGFDLTATGTNKSKTIRVPNPLVYLGYIYSPATSCLGPWISFASYLDSLVPRNSWLVTLRRLLPNLVLCLVALVVSNCIAPFLGELFASSSHFLGMYFEAMSVRSSHYFVSFIAQALLVASDQGTENESQWLGPLVTQPWRIEWPRSISSLVRSWNIPMHEWLKRYVYGPWKKEDGSKGRTILAVLCTYLVSSLLHGMDLRIYLVLISLAIFGEGEVLLRRHISSVLDACLSANRCRGRDRCRYANCPKKRNWLCFRSCLIRLANLGFTALTIFHLAYLGVVLLGESLESSDDHESFLAHWQRAGYLSHYIGVGTFVLYLFIS